MGIFRQLEELAAPEIFAEMRYPYIGLFWTVFFKIGIIKAPV